MVRQDWLTSLFQAWQQWLRLSAEEPKTLFESRLSRMNGQTFSIGPLTSLRKALSSGERGGSGMRVVLSGDDGVARAIPAGLVDFSEVEHHALGVAAGQDADRGCQTNGKIDFADLLTELSHGPAPLTLFVKLGVLGTERVRPAFAF